MMRIACALLFAVLGALLVVTTNAVRLSGALYKMAAVELIVTMGVLIASVAVFARLSTRACARTVAVTAAGSMVVGIALVQVVRLVPDGCSISAWRLAARQVAYIADAGGCDIPEMRRVLEPLPHQLTIVESALGSRTIVVSFRRGTRGSVPLEDWLRASYIWPRSIHTDLRNWLYEDYRLEFIATCAAEQS